MGEQDAVHIVDDDASMRRALQRLLRSAGYTATTYATAASLIDAVPHLSGCLLLDLRIPDMSGLELQAQLAKRSVRLPVVIVTGHGDISSAVQAMQAGALDILEKPLDENRLLAAIAAAFKEAAQTTRNTDAMRAVERVAMLSPRERQVLQGIVAGKATKVIAIDLDLSVRTVEVHRARLLVRLGTHSMAEAVRIAVLAEIA